MKVRFYNRERPHDAGFSLDFSQGASYDEVVREVAEQLGVQPKFLLFFRPHRSAARVHRLTGMPGRGRG